MDGDRPNRRKRGPYKQYLFDPALKVPRSTLWDSQHRDPGRAQPALGPNDQGEVLNELVAPADNEINDEDGQGQMHDIDDGEEPSANLDNENENEYAEDTNDKPVRTKVDYIIKYNLHERLHRDFPLSRLDVLLMILHLAIRHCHTEQFIMDQILFVNTSFGNNVLDISYHIFKELFPSSKSIVKHYFCPDCQVSLGSEKDFVGLKETVCQKCKKSQKVNSVDLQNYFIILSVKEQIENLLQRPGVKLIDFSTRERPDGNICDIFDGEIYSKCLESGLDLGNALTVTFNTDGVAVHESTKNSLWPILLHLNEVVPEQRFHVDNLILGGLWFGKSAPTMALFLKPFLNQLLDLSVGGVKHQKPDGTVKTYPVFPLACSVDSVAKPKVLCQKQFNAFCACLYCVHPNDGKVEGSNMRFYDTSTTYPVRTEDDVMSDMCEADEQDRAGQLKKGSVNGFLGLSVLLIFSKLLKSFPCNPFNIVWSVVIDYMHAVCEGVTHQLLELFIEILTPEQLRLLNDRLDNITPPKAMTRRPRNLTEKINWKAKESRAFLLYYAIPCLEDLLPVRHFRNLKSFVSAMHILLGDLITPQSLSQARSHLKTFVTEFQNLYGLSAVTYNLHLQTHLCDLVAMVGPLWCFSNFVFESGNGRLIKLIRGTRSIINEIAKKFTKLQYASNIIGENPVHKSALDFCNKLLNYDHSNSSKMVGDVCVTGSMSSSKICPVSVGLLIHSNVEVYNETVKFYNRVIRKGIIYTSKSYTKNKVYDDSCVLLTDGRFAIIDKIVEDIEGDLLCLVKILNIAEEIIPPVKKCAYHFEGDFAVVPFNMILSKCVLVSVASTNYVCRIPNFFERD